MKRLCCLAGIAALTGFGTAEVAGADRGIHPAEPAGKYMTEVVKQKLGNEYELAWQTLYPRHQRVAAKDAYVACESLTQSAGTLVGIKVLRVFDERIRVAGARAKLKTRAVRVRVAVNSPTFTLFPVTITQTFHAIAVRGEWKWILSPYQYAYYSAESCPYA